MKEQKTMNYSSNPKVPFPSPRNAGRGHLLIAAGLVILLAVGGLALPEAEHRNKILGLWPVLIFAPIPLLTWLNQGRADAETADGTPPLSERTGKPNERNTGR
jgi:hypothetical protein